MHLTGSQCAYSIVSHTKNSCDIGHTFISHRSCRRLAAASPRRVLGPQDGDITGVCGRYSAHACASTSAAASASVPSAAHGSESTEELKGQLRKALNGIDRGIFGTQAAKRQEILALLDKLEASNPLLNPTEHLEQVAGDWRLLYTTITITGSKKTKLGLREFVKLGDFIQSIDTVNSLATNTVAFSVAGLGTLSGALTVKASYSPASATRVNITFEQSTLVPEKLQQIFQANYKLLLSIFNPDGWLDITYVDEELRVGRDDKGNVFLLERCV